MRSEFEAISGGLTLNTPALDVALEMAADSVPSVPFAERLAIRKRHLAGVAPDAIFTPSDVERRCTALTRELREAPVNFGTPPKPNIVATETTKALDGDTRRSFRITRAS